MRRNPVPRPMVLEDLRAEKPAVIGPMGTPSQARLEGWQQGVVLNNPEFYFRHEPPCRAGYLYVSKIVARDYNDCCPVCGQKLSD